MRFTRSNGTAPWRVDCEDFGTSAATAIVDKTTGKKVAFAVDQIALGFPDSYLNLSHADLMLDALNVHEATGLTPSQLQARVAELEAALSTVLVSAECHADFSNGVVCPNTGADQGEATASEILRECRAVLERKS